MIAVVPVRDGASPAGADEAVSEAGGRVIVVGSGTASAVAGLSPVASEVWTIDLPAGTGLDAAHCAVLVTAAVARVGADHETIVLPASPDGRDLGPHIAARLGRDFFAGALEITPDHVSVPARGGLAITDHRPGSAFVATLQVGVRTAEPAPSDTDVVNLDATALVEPGSSAPAVESLAVLPPDAATIDLGEAPRIVGGGAGLVDADRFEALARVAAHLDASMGVTRVITDRGWVGHERQIGTTGVVVDPDLYIAFGISGAVQHTSGLGQPEHIISVNTDAHCPMMQLSDIAIVSDANATLTELLRLLEERNPRT